MHNNKKVFWIASYPKSGNTWIRAIIASLFFSKNGCFDFALLSKIINFELPSSYKFVKSISDKDYKNLNKLDIVSKYRIESQKRATIIQGDFAFFKTHSSNLKVNNFDYTNNSSCLGFIYIVRDPRDIAISYSKFLGKNMDEIIDMMIDKGSITYNESIPYLQTSWDLHYITWRHINVPKLIIRYEDLLYNTEFIIRKIAEFFNENFGFKFNNFENNIQNILTTTNFNNLQKLERKDGFSGANKATKSLFFRKGKSKQWKNKLNTGQLKNIQNNFKKTMEELKYL